MVPALELRGVVKRFLAGARGCTASADALRWADFSILEGQTVALVGGAGAGKSTLLFCAAGLLLPDAGTIAWFGDGRVSRAASRASYYFGGSRAPARNRVGLKGAPHLHLIDEPESLPAETVARLARWIERRQLVGDAIVLATRDLALAHRLAGRVVSMRDGRVHPVVQPPRAARVAERLVAVAPEGGTM